MFRKNTYFIDTTKGPMIKTRYTLNIKPLITLLLAIIFIATTLLFVAATTEAPEEPQITMHCTNANILVFQDLSGNYLAYVRYANAKQLEEIMSLNILADESVNDFRLCITEPHHYEIRLDGELVFVHADDVIPPAKYNYTLSEQEESDMLNASSDEVRYLYAELNRIFKIS